MKRNAGITLVRRQRGFTLMEVMISIAVLGVLTAIGRALLYKHDQQEPPGVAVE